MDAETLERLMIDASLGALDPDVEAMLRAYLEREPSAARQAAAFDETARLVRRALQSPSPVALPPFPAQALQAAQRRRATMWFVRQGLAMAACVLLGFGVSAFRASPPGGSQMLQTVATDGPTMQPAVVNAGGFWSTQKWFDRAARAERHAAGGAIWHSPVERPTFGGNT